jgi:hypothetical protein
MYTKEKKSVWYRFLIEGEDLWKQLIPANKFEQKAVEEMLINYANNIVDATVLQKIESFVETYLRDDYRNRLKSKKWSIRINTLYRIFDFRMYSLMDDCIEMLNAKKSYSEEEYFLIYKILSFHHHNELFISHMINPKYTIGEMEYKKLLFHADKQTLQQFILKYEDLPKSLKHTLIDIIGLKYGVDYILFLEDKLEDNDVEVRIRVLKAIGQIGFIRNMELYLPFIESDYWEERLMAAKLLGNVPISTAQQYLEELLQDSTWWVRSQAAKTLRGSKFGKEILESFIHSSDDRYAVDMAREVLGKEKII